MTETTWTIGRGRAAAAASALLIGAAAAFAAAPDAKKIDAKAVEPSGEKIAEIEEAGEFLKKGQVEKALDKLKDIARRRADLPPAEVMLARMFLAAGQTQQGRSLLEQAALDMPDSADVFVSFGNLAVGEGRVTDAQALFERALTLINADAKIVKKKKDDLLVACRSGLAFVAESRKNWTGAVEQLNAMLAVKPVRPDRTEEARALQRLARSRFFLGKPDEAYADLQAAIKADPKIEAPAVSMANLHTMRALEAEALKANPPLFPPAVTPPDPKEDFAKAEEWMQKAVKVDPKDVKAAVAFAAWLVDRNRPEDAKAQGDAAAKLDGDSAEVLRLQGLIARRLRKPELAEASFEKLYARSPGDAFVVNQLALSLAEQSSEVKKNRAMELALVNARAYQRDPEALASLGWICYKNGKLADAERFLRQAVEVSGGRVSSDIAYYMAFLMNEQGKLDEVLKLLKAALDNRGRFQYRREAEEWMARLKPGPGPGAETKKAP